MLETMGLIRELGFSPETIALQKTLSFHLCSFHPSVNKVTDGVARSARRDVTLILTDFERTYFSISKRIFYFQFAQFLTLDDDVMGTREK